MTENEALKRMKMCIGVSPSENIISSFKLMSDALDELQRYREIGTIEEIKALKKKEELFDRNIKMFESIGLKIQQKTIDEFVERIVQYCSMSEINRKMIQQIAEEMRGAE